MQDIHAIGGGGRFFGGGDRRLRPHNHQQALKCPRCDSFNTKFCYYNNYNLSQPRHFCKGCRRYWTKGGVLRNVPVGGGCRKTKRSNKPKSGSGDVARERSSNARSSSSESSGLTAATPASGATAPAAEQGSAPSNTPPGSAVVYNFSDSRSFNGNPNFNRQVNPTSEDQIFPSESGNFGNLTTSSAGMLGFGMADILTTSYGQVHQGNQAPEPPDNPCLGTSAVEAFKESVGMRDGGLVTPALEWGAVGSGGGGGGGEDQELFDLTAAVDPAYWSQPQWTDGGDQSLDYLR